MESPTVPSPGQHDVFLISTPGWTRDKAIFRRVGKPDLLIESEPNTALVYVNERAPRRVRLGPEGSQRFWEMVADGGKNVREGVIVTILEEVRKEGD